MNRTIFHRCLREFTKISPPSLCERDPDDPRMGYRHHGLAIHAAQSAEKPIPAIGDGLCVLAAAGAVAPQVLSPAIELLSRHGFPGPAFPGSEIHLDEIVIDNRHTRRSKRA